MHGRWRTKATDHGKPNEQARVQHLDHWREFVFIVAINYQMARSHPKKELTKPVFAFDFDHFWIKNYHNLSVVDWSFITEDVFHNSFTGNPWGVCCASHGGISKTCIFHLPSWSRIWLLQSVSLSQLLNEGAHTQSTMSTDWMAGEKLNLRIWRHPPSHTLWRRNASCLHAHFLANHTCAAVHAVYRTLAVRQFLSVDADADGQERWHPRASGYQCYVPLSPHGLTWRTA